MKREVLNEIFKFYGLDIDELETEDLNALEVDLNIYLSSLK